MFTDTHCHVLSTSYYNPEKIINGLESNNIKRIIINGYNLKTNKEVVLLSTKYSNVYGALGIHPDNINENLEDSINFIKNNAHNPKIIAIGEIGLDYYHNKNNKQEQIELLETFFKLAKELSLPVIIHNRDATDDLLRLLKKYNLKGIIHCFSGSVETAREYIKLGFKLGIGGVLTFKKSKLPETLKEIPLSSILLETDSPYLTPAPLRGIPNEPTYLKFVADTLCDIYNTNLNELSSTLEKSFNEIFDINN